MDEAKDAYVELKEFFRHTDPQHLREDEIFEKLGYIDIQNLAPRIQAEVFGGLALWIQSVHRPVNSLPLTKLRRRNKWHFIQISAMRNCLD
jgi:cephalosporin-C deacetylase-like acetyl esterase